MFVRLFSTSLVLTTATAAVLLAGCSDPATPGGTGGATGSGGGTASGGTGSGGEATGSGGSTADTTVPSDTTEAGIAAFLAAGSYKSAPWVGDAAVRTPTSSTNVHGDVRVYYNPTAITSIENGQNEISHETGNSLNSMAVKELYDSTGTQIGTAVMLRVAETGADTDWLYSCSSTAGGCASMTDGGPFHGTGLDDCRFCHGGMFIGPTPE